MKFKCLDNCGKCCGNVPIKKKIYEENLLKVLTKVHKLYELEHDEVLPITTDGKCLFLCKNKKCLIYKNRPEVCRLYGKIRELPCPYINRFGMKRSVIDISIMEKKINEDVDKQLGLLQKKVL